MTKRKGRAPIPLAPPPIRSLKRARWIVSDFHAKVRARARARRARSRARARDAAYPRGPPTVGRTARRASQCARPPCGNFPPRGPARADAAAPRARVAVRHPGGARGPAAGCGIPTDVPPCATASTPPAGPRRPSTPTTKKPRRAPSQRSRPRAGCGARARALRQHRDDVAVMTRAGSWDRARGAAPAFAAATSR